MCYCSVTTYDEQNDQITLVISWQTIKSTRKLAPIIWQKARKKKASTTYPPHSSKFKLVCIIMLQCNSSSCPLVNFTTSFICSYLARFLNWESKHLRSLLCSSSRWKKLRTWIAYTETQMNPLKLESRTFFLAWLWKKRWAKWPR